MPAARAQGVGCGNTPPRSFSQREGFLVQVSRKDELMGVLGLQGLGIGRYRFVGLINI